jgi:hypothetical protein
MSINPELMDTLVILVILEIMVIEIITITILARIESKSFLTHSDEKETVLKSINNFGNLVKNLNEENSKIKPPTRDYTEVDFGGKYRPKREDLQRPQFISNKVHKEDEKPVELQRPTFVNKNIDNKNSNFVELNTQGDVKV